MGHPDRPVNNRDTIRVLARARTNSFNNVREGQHSASPGK
jgi:hypothetical protein